MAQSLEQLKQENAKEEAAALASESVIETELIKDEYVEDKPEALAASEEAAAEQSNDTDDLDEEAKVEKPVELWMQDEEQTSSNNDAESFGSSDMAKLRRKLKAKNDEKDDEIAQLRADIDAMKNGISTNSAPQVSVQSIARPKLEDFDYDEDKYNESLDEYYISRMSQQNNQTQVNAQQEQAQQAAKQSQQKKLDSHYEQVSDLITSNTLTAEMYQNSEIVLRKSLDNVSKGNGDSLTDTIIAQLASLGDGGAKVITHLGRNATNRNRLVAALADDPTGLTMMGILGELKATLTSAPAKKISSAPTPSAKLSGGEPSGDSSAKLARKYKEADKHNFNCSRGKPCDICCGTYQYNRTRPGSRGVGRHRCSGHGTEGLRRSEAVRH